MKLKSLYYIISFLILSQFVFGQKVSKVPQSYEKLDWKATSFSVDTETGKKKPNFYFKNIEFNNELNFRPFFAVYHISDPNTILDANLTVISVDPVSEEEKQAIEFAWPTVSESFEIKNTSGIGSGKRHNRAEICPFRKNNAGSYDKLTSYSIQWKSKPGTEKINSLNSVSTYATNSVLSSGTWYKIGITKNGVYKIDKQFLQTMGINPEGIDPRNIQLYGNGGRLLSEKNSDPKYDDLIENAISIVGENDGSFDQGDYISFYGKGPNQWEYNMLNSSDLKYNYIKHYYSDTAYYFLTIGSSPGKRTQQKVSLDGSENYNTSTFDDFGFHELDAQNLIKSGREFYGEHFDILTQYSFGFNFPNLVSGDTMFVKASVTGRNTSPTSGTGSIPTSFIMSLTDNQSMSFLISPVGPVYTSPIANEQTLFKKYVSNSASAFSYSITKQTPSSTGWFNYVRVNARRSLQYVNSQLSFRDSRTYATGRISKFALNSSLALTIWDVTDHFNVEEQLTNTSGNLIDFVSATDTLREYVAFGINDLYSPNFIGKVANQNLHAYTQDYDYIIITHPMFKSQALQLAEIHQQYDTLSYVIATPQEIYNEFSSGSQDITAIREFIRMLYTRATVKPRYLLLLGDASYVYKTGISGNNTNYVPTYQTYNSLAFTVSKSADDFFGLLDDNEGAATGSEIVDIGIGRLPVKTSDEATAMVEKVKHYYLQQGDLNTEMTACDNSVYSTFGDWRNWVCFLADDVDEGWETAFVASHSEPFSAQVKSLAPTFNIDKIYLDAFQQFSTSSGQRYPDAETALEKRIQKGALILNYSGHGGELALTTEGIVDVNIVNNWKNLNNMPMFLTATCEFSRFDDPSRTSAGEYVLLNPQGGGISLFTTTRIAFSTDANSLCPPFFNAALNELNGWFPRTGDIIKLTKQSASPSYTHFVLLGDPAVTLAYPKLKIFTSEINSVPVSAAGNDTLKALSKITIKGYVGTKDSTKLTNFNGIVFPTVFDKPIALSTLGNDQGPSSVINFSMQKNVLYKGKCSVSNGEFEFTFVVPKDINYQFGNGKISYYGHNGSIDASGYYDKIVVGGSNPNAPIDNEGPQLNLYMNDDHFVYGGTTNENPKIFMKLFDSCGINTVGNGIGHDITAILDNNQTNPIVLNDFYEANYNSYQSGKIFYPLNNMSEGNHTLSVKAWDVQNNSSTINTEFIVAASAELALRQVLNYPNPFTTKTKFFVEHNQCCTDLNLQIQIFTVSGKLIKTIHSDIQNQGYRIDGIDWDGKDDYGDKIGAGVYIYRVKARSSDGKSSEKIEKLVILN
ncbi:MAG: type IX secretion system sortase PorU [Bacteroidota bacterium]|nr:type IX secretion system sortase PorU [Bacteroidota bacterium]